MNTARDITPSARRQSRPTLEGRRKPLRSQVLGGYWRIPVFALVGAVLAFGVSFIFQSQYSAVTRLIIHPNDSSYAGTDSGAEVTGSVNIGGIDITKQTTLGNTLVNLATSNEAAAEIVKRIGVEKINGSKQAPELGTTSKIVNFLKVGGTGTAPTAEQAAIDHVRGALNVVVLDESWVMEITAWDADPKLAALIANTAADVAVTQGADRFKENSVRELDYLNGQIAASQANVAAKAQAVEQFQAAHTTPAEIAAGAGQLAALQSDLSDARDANKALEDRQAAVSAIVNKPRFDSSRLGTVVVSNTPARPMRYLFLLVGALVGALAGLLLTWFRSIREDEESTDDGSTSGGDDDAGRPRGADLDGRPDVRFDEVIDVRHPDVGAPRDGGTVLPPMVRPTVQEDVPEESPSATPVSAESVLEESVLEEPVPEEQVQEDLPKESVATSATASVDATIAPNDVGHIAAALFDRPGTTRFSG
ncbi:MAG: hypothetical protein JST64_15435 [Actinobacteria bacterium]|nr:hypothetical protein [Actinomycetota bacterium]